MFLVLIINLNYYCCEKRGGNAHVRRPSCVAGDLYFFSSFFFFFFKGKDALSSASARRSCSSRYEREFMNALFLPPRFPLGLVTLKASRQYSRAQETPVGESPPGWVYLVPWNVIIKKARSLSSFTPVKWNVRVKNSIKRTASVSPGDGARSRGDLHSLSARTRIVVSCRQNK